MSLAQITEKIKNDAVREAEEIIARAKTQAEGIAQRAAEENDSVKSGYARRFDVERPEIFRRREIVAALDVKKMELQSQRDIINDVYSSALERLKGLERAEYLDFCAALLTGAASTKEETLYVGTGEKYIDREWVGEYNRKHGAKITFAEERLPDISGGFILENGRIAVNCSWEMLIQIAQEKYETDVIKRLFPSAD